MPHWMVKAVSQKAISLLPGKHTWNHLFQTYVTKSLDLERSEGPCRTRFDYKLMQCRRHIEDYMGFGPSPAGQAILEGRNALELGTGWNPIVPVGLFLCGAGNIWTIDQAPLLHRERVRDVLTRFVASAGRADFKQMLPQASDRRIAEIESALASNSLSLSALLERLHIHPVVGDARHTSVPAASIDLIVSNNTLEHIPADVLPAIFREFRRLAAPSAVMSHYIDMTDHYVNFDANASPYNFLRYSAATWRWLNNSLQYLNRLRIADYRALHDAGGFSVVDEQDTSEAGRLAGQPLAREFQRYAPADLAVTTSWLVSTAKGE